jgi:DNA ligase 1
LKRFTALYKQLDASTSTTAKVAAMAAYFAQAATDDAAWASYVLAGGKPKQAVPTALMRELACQIAGLEPWLFEESYQVVGDLAETIAYVLPAPTQDDDASLSQWMNERILPMRVLDREVQAHAVMQAWSHLDADARFIFVKLVGGGFRVGVSKLLVQRALAQAFNLDAKVLAQRMMGYTDAKRAPTAERFAALVAPDRAATAHPDGVTPPSRDDALPYPFFLAHPLEVEPLTLGDASDWRAEWKYDGIRAQIVKRSSQAHVWTRGEELVTERYPEVMQAAAAWPQGSVLDGELLVWLPGSDRPAPFALLQKRIGRLSLSKKLLLEAPVCFMAYDLLEQQGTDLREQPFDARRAQLESFVATHAHPNLRLSPLVADGLPVSGSSWPALTALRAQSRERGVEGFMLKHRESRYGQGRTKAAGGGWWKWKIEPLTVDAVLVYAQAGHGRRANVYTDYTFAVWSREPRGAQEVQGVLDAIAARRAPEPGALQLVAFAKAYSGLSDAEFKRVDAEIRKRTVEKFGPVRSVVPSLVFELGFEGIGRSPRHKSGVAVRFPRMLRIRDDKPLHEAETLPRLMALVDAMDATQTTRAADDPSNDEAGDSNDGQRGAQPA